MASCLQLSLDKQAGELIGVSCQAKVRESLSKQRRESNRFQISKLIPSKEYFRQVTPQHYPLSNEYPNNEFVGHSTSDSKLYGIFDSIRIRYEEVLESLSANTAGIVSELMVDYVRVYLIRTPLVGRSLSMSGAGSRELAFH